jgi:endonuclease YncB( thermonuclease family)
MNCSQNIDELIDAPFFTLKGRECDGKIVRVTDGDTVHALMDLDGTVYKWKCRIAHVDTPELHSRDETEKRHATNARDRLSELVLGRTVRVKCSSFDMYGRVLVELTVPCTETTEEIVVHEWLLQNGLALPYEGKTKQKWVFTDR